MKFQFLSQVGGHADDDVLALLVASHPVPAILNVEFPAENGSSFSITLMIIVDVAVGCPLWSGDVDEAHPARLVEGAVALRCRPPWCWSSARPPYSGTEVFCALAALESFCKRLWDTSHVDFWPGVLRHHEPTIPMACPIVGGTVSLPFMQHLSLAPCSGLPSRNTPSEQKESQESFPSLSTS